MNHIPPYITATRHFSRRAAFRRVAGGVSCGVLGMVCALSAATAVPASGAETKHLMSHAMAGFKNRDMLTILKTARCSNSGVSYGECPCLGDFKATA